MKQIIAFLLLISCITGCTDCECTNINGSSNFRVTMSYRLERDVVKVWSNDTSFIYYHVEFPLQNGGVRRFIGEIRPKVEKSITWYSESDGEKVNAETSIELNECLRMSGWNNSMHVLSAPVPLLPQKVELVNDSLIGDEDGPHH